MLQVRAPGKASWLWRFQFGGRRRDMGFGPWPEVPLTKARERLFKAKQVLAEGRDPLDERIVLSRPVDATFDEMAAAYIESHRAGWKAKADQAWRATLGTYASPVIGTLACSDITTVTINADNRATVMVAANVASQTRTAPKAQARTPGTAVCAGS